jgi:hypothetical protein
VGSNPSYHNHRVQVLQILCEYYYGYLIEYFFIFFLGKYQTSCIQIKQLLLAQYLQNSFKYPREFGKVNVELANLSFKSVFQV